MLIQGSPICGQPVCFQLPCILVGNQTHRDQILVSRRVQLQVVTTIIRSILSSPFALYLIDSSNNFVDVKGINRIQLCLQIQQIVNSVEPSPTTL